MVARLSTEISDLKHNFFQLIVDVRAVWGKTAGRMPALPLRSDSNRWVELELGRGEWAWLEAGVWVHFGRKGGVRG